MVDLLISSVSAWRDRYFPGETDDNPDSKTDIIQSTPHDIRIGLELRDIDKGRRDAIIHDLYGLAQERKAALYSDRLLSTEEELAHALRGAGGIVYLRS